jgi:DNA-binding GntR family transcriptional regulator
MTRKNVGPTATHLYAKIETALREDIMSGRQAVGSCLPPEHDLARRFSASRFTVRRALAELRERGLVESRVGHGTFVIASREGDGFVQSLASFEELLQYPPGTRRETVRIEEVAATGARAEELDCAEGTLWVRLRAVRWLKAPDRAIAFIDGWIAPRFADVLSKPNPHSAALLSQIEEWHGHRAAKAEVQIAAGSLSAEIAPWLQADPGSAALVIRRRYRDPDGQIYLMTISTHPEHRFALTLDFDRGSQINQRSTT